MTLDTARRAFPPEFIWGAATSAYQIEGSPLADGAGPSDWHEFSHTPSRIWQNHNGDVACDHYRRWGEDVELMRQLGLQAYRFSIAWPRIFPAGTGAVNARGLDFYQRLVDALLAADIQPHATLFHWDLPAALQREGGWLHEDSPQWLADYARVVVDALGDRVASWATINEPWVVANHGYVEGVHPPGRRHDYAAFCQAAHHLVLAHQRAAQAARAAGARRVGLVVNLTPQHPGSDAQQDQDAARRSHAYVNELFLHPLFFGRYPLELKERFAEASAAWREDELSPAAAAVDFLGVNYYLRDVVIAATTGPALAEPLIDPRVPRSAMGWEIYPQGLTEILTWIRSTYGQVPLYVTENGACFDDPLPREGIIEDTDRIDYLEQHFEAAAAAVTQGVDLRGFFVWSLLDNFEWSYGYSKRFGLVAVDAQTLQRQPKASAHFYRRWISR